MMHLWHTLSWRERAVPIAATALFLFCLANQYLSWGLLGNRPTVLYPIIVVGAIAWNIYLRRSGR